MERLVERKNIVVGGIMYGMMLLMYCINSLSYVSTIIRGYGDPYTYSYLITYGIVIISVIAALIIMIVRKRQSGFGVTLPMIAMLIVNIGTRIMRISYYYPYGGIGIWDILPLLVIVPIVIVIVFFFVPSKAMRIVAASVVGLSIVIRIILELGTYRYSDPFASIGFLIGYLAGISIHGLIIVQIFMSFQSSGNQPVIGNQPYAYPYPQAPVANPYHQPSVANTYPQAPVANPYPQAPLAPSAAPVPQPIPKEQILANYRNLLNQGLITQEQFDAKKNELQ